MSAPFYNPDAEWIRQCILQTIQDISSEAQELEASEAITPMQALHAAAARLSARARNRRKEIGL